MACSCHDTAATNTCVLVLPGAVVGSVAGAVVGSSAGAVVGSSAGAVVGSVTGAVVGAMEVAGPVVVAAIKIHQTSASPTTAFFKHFQARMLENDFTHRVCALNAQEPSAYTYVVTYDHAQGSGKKHGMLCSCVH